MYKAILAAQIIILNFKYAYSAVLGEDNIDETTPKPLDISLLSYPEWCKFQPNLYDCGKTGKPRYRFYFDLKLKDCKATPIGDCAENYNTFTDLDECSDLCRDINQRHLSPNLTANVFCRMQYDFGECNDYYPMWYFDVSTKNCRGFSYSGCGGNSNKFKTASDCTGVCVPAMEYIRDL